MGIRGLTKYIKRHGLMVEHQLRDCNLVVDGSCFLRGGWDINGDNGDHAYGGDYDIFAKYLSRMLQNIAKYNITCYVVFNGEHLACDHGQEYEHLQNQLINTAMIKPNNDEVKTGIRFKMPRNVLTDILDEHKIQYITSLHESEQDFIALAKHFDCPILSYDSHTFLCDIPVVQFDHVIHIDTETNSLKCEIFFLVNLLEKFKVAKEMIPIFFVVFHRYIFVEDYFKKFFEFAGISWQYVERITELLQWLCKHSYDSAVEIILSYVREDDKQKFLNALEDAKERYLVAFESPAVKYFTENAYQENSVSVNDTNWFQTGIDLKYIYFKFVNLYHRKIYSFKPTVEDFGKDDSFLPSIKILRYSFDLLTNFEKLDFCFTGREGLNVHEYTITSSEYSIATPVYKAIKSPFENGWDNLPDYFGHFLRETLPGLPYELISQLPSDCQLLMISLVWWKHYVDTGSEQDVYCLLLSYLLVGTINDKICRVSYFLLDPSVYILTNPELETGELLLEKEKITLEDCLLARNILEKYYPSPKYVEGIYCPQPNKENYDVTILHSFVQFRNCLTQLCNLNKLCGSPYDSVMFHKFYNGSFIYNVFCFMNGVEDPAGFVTEYLGVAGTVCRFYASLCKVLEKCLSSVNDNNNVQ